MRVDSAADARWMAAALALSERTRARTYPNPNVGCVLVRDGTVVGRGWTQSGGRPHAEAMALDQAGARARGATAYVTLEPCAHASPRGPACADLLVAAGIVRAVVALGDPDPRTDGSGLARLRVAGIAVELGRGADAARRAMAGFLTRRTLGRPHVTLKLALSLDGAAAMADGRSQWITGREARAHAHLERARHGAILVGRGTWEADRPRLDVRLAGLEARAPLRVVLSSGAEAAGDPHPSGATRLPPSPAGSEKAPIAVGDGKGGGDSVWITTPAAIAALRADHLLVEGGARTAAAFLRADLVDRLLLYRAPILIGGGRTLPDIGLAALGDAHARWRLADSRQLGSDRLEVYERG
ncbi:bifunctional diaminohydroxyphosphoribosylaminopyrimidine deaminase/5-amino-6-(5-phosphoribosylamino)uracil reductase RibD [Sphingomonas yunnanensis]|uniref:bifunctional diaminohydroxyphosphoribosylaminopyrimidine deaminase/5-amino-6-(5-phosphoribosylamino)uracil reductase RibD n=1 Tax=Sphingomonas yunnanensis TaxID=310400 RepID=UPI001CA62322|nr:bifunctional diaminohydroxyphosphoribosylaminopyrimidine deaminase/5-amino-6-(5-phosphoribosylamino)uracil reductase RibD [Sphingomonas yunnanensis]MBY9063107.1 bifunctional diaminohydroxyphosphoribosylaminopyrimidine deaminase/5-amino-6-(5-phosphoribosylamino)uracil reductase RibD [Sphingomonas yunnanensis]